MTIEDVLFSFSCTEDLSVMRVEQLIREYAMQTNRRLDTPRDWLEVADALWVAL